MERADLQMNEDDDSPSIFNLREDDWPQHAHQLAKFALCKALDELADQDLSPEEYVVCFNMYILMQGPPYVVETIRILDIITWAENESTFCSKWILVFPADICVRKLKTLVNAWIRSWNE